MTSPAIMAAGAAATVFLCYPAARRGALFLVDRSDAAWRRSSLDWLSLQGGTSSDEAPGKTGKPIPRTPPRPGLDWTMRLAFAGLAGALGFSSPEVWVTAVLVLICLLLATAAVADLMDRILPDLAVSAVGLLFIALAVSGHGPTPRDALIGLAAGGFSFWIIASGYRLIRGREGLGLGDAKLFATAGLATGWVTLPHVALGAVLITVAGLLVRRAVFFAESSTVIPFGPAIAISTLLVLSLMRLAELPIGLGT